MLTVEIEGRLEASQDFLRVGGEQRQREQHGDPGILQDEVRGSTERELHTPLFKRATHPGNLRDKCRGNSYAVRTGHASQDGDRVFEIRGSKEHPTDHHGKERDQSPDSATQRLRACRILSEPLRSVHARYG